MSWRDLLQESEESLVAPWLGGRSLQTYSRTWRLEGRFPPEFGWHRFTLAGRKAFWKGSAETFPDLLKGFVEGYLVGDRLVPDNVSVSLDPAQLVSCSERVWFVEPGLDRFVRVTAGRPYEEGPLIYQAQGFPLGPEEEVLQAYLDQKTSVDDIRGVAPALDVAFRFESWIRAEAERRRQEELERRRQEELLRAREERRRRIVEELGDAAGRRELAVYDFAEAARAALRIGGAEYLDHRQSPIPNEKVVRFRLNGRRFECVCDQRTLRILDAGICLTDHDTGRKDDMLLTLESISGVIREAERRGVLVVFRHVD